MFSALLCLCFPTADLGSPVWSVRAAAERRLAAAWPLSGPALAGAAESPDAEVRRRTYSAYRRGAYRVLGDYSRYHPLDWPAVLVLRADFGDAGGLPVTPCEDYGGHATPGDPAYLAAVFRRAGVLYPGEKLAGEWQPDEWWSAFPVVTLDVVRWRYRGLDGLSDDAARAAWAETRKRW